jgi:hypothetical protein
MSAGSISQRQRGKTKWRYDYTFFFLFSFLPLFSATQGSLTGADLPPMQLSCSSVYDDVNDQANFCTMVSWLSAQMYTPSNYSLYYPQSPISVHEQDLYAKDLYHSLRAQFRSDRPSCKNSLKRLACAQVFPECPEAGLSMSGISYFPTCAIQCQQTEALCDQHVNCHNFSTFNCMTILPPGYFILSPSEVSILFLHLFLTTLALARDRTMLSPASTEQSWALGLSSQSIGTWLPLSSTKTPLWSSAKLSPRSLSSRSWCSSWGPLSGAPATSGRCAPSGWAYPSSTLILFSKQVCCSFFLSPLNPCDLSSPPCGLLCRDDGVLPACRQRLEHHSRQLLSE